MDSEFCALLRVVSEAEDLQTVAAAHGDFLSSVVRLALLDNAVLRDSLDTILHICMRFQALCRLQTKSEEWEGDGIAPFVPPEEFGAVHRDFLAQVAMLFKILKDVDSRGFLFRLDFNGFLSSD